MSRKPVKVTVVIGSLDRGGAETHLLRTLPRLDSSKYQIVVLAFRRTGELAEEMERSGVKVVGPWLGGSKLVEKRSLLLVRVALAYLCLLWHLVVNRPQIIHFFLPQSYMFAAPIAILLRIRVKVMSRRSLNRYFEGRHGCLKKIEMWLHSRMDAILANSREVALELVEDEGCDSQRVLLLHNGVDVAQRNSPPNSMQLRRELDISDEDIVLVKTANLIPYKGHSDLLRACALLQVSKWKLLLVGGDPEGLSRSLLDEAKQLGISTNVLFLGQRSDVEQVLAQSDIGILASHEEGFSNALLEYMAAGIPAVVTNVGGNPDALIDGETGVLVPPKSPKAMAQAIEQLIELEDCGRAMGDRARSRVFEKFSQTACAKGYEKIYCELLQDRPDLSKTGYLVSYYLKNNRK